MAKAIPIGVAKDPKTKVEKVKQRKVIENNLMTSATLEPPKTLTKVAKAEWIRIMNLYSLMPVKILSDLDIATLTVYCEAVAIYQEAQSKWKQLGAVVSQDKDTQRVLTEIRKIMNEQATIIDKCSTDLCLNPVGRAKMGINPADKEIADPLDKLLAKFGE